MLTKYQADAQPALDTLYREHLIPFRLQAQKVTEESPGEFRIHFYDSRLHSVLIDVKKESSIGDQVRAAVLLRMEFRTASVTTGERRQRSA